MTTGYRRVLSTDHELIIERESVTIYSRETAKAIRLMVSDIDEQELLIDVICHRP